MTAAVAFVYIAPCDRNPAHDAEWVGTVSASGTSYGDGPECRTCGDRPWGVWTQAGRWREMAELAGGDAA